MSRILIETVIRQTLNNIKIDPKRSIRNVVDMALHFSAGRFQKEFFRAAQNMLQNRRSAYYELIEDTVSHVEQERLLTFGMNVGYNGCTVGAEQICALEWQENFNVPWCISLQLQEEPAPRYHDLICRGESLGIYNWMLFGEGDLSKLLSLPQRHPDSAFFLFCSPEDISKAWIEQAADLKNLMFVVKFEGKAALTCALLREMGLLYSLYYPYSQWEVLDIVGGDLLNETRELHPLFTILTAQPDCPTNYRDKVYNYVLQTRNDQTVATIPWELEYDNRWIDSIISHEGCVVTFDPEGQLLGFDAKETLNFHHNDLKNILKLAFPKGGHAC